eukprot:INCI3653.2.p1 GENE.INCI3653.2~~INCI3653.2.p1  ORF type:complete len:1249 (+),score=195.68 INCI3653.2:86-3748(+)
MEARRRSGSPVSALPLGSAAVSSSSARRAAASGSYRSSIHRSSASSASSSPVRRVADPQSLASRALVLDEIKSLRLGRLGSSSSRTGSDGVGRNNQAHHQRRPHSMSPKRTPSTAVFTGSDTDNGEDGSGFLSPSMLSPCGQKRLLRPTTSMPRIFGFTSYHDTDNVGGRDSPDHGFGRNRQGDDFDPASFPGLRRERQRPATAFERRADEMANIRKAFQTLRSARRDSRSASGEKVLSHAEYASRKAVWHEEDDTAANAGMQALTAFYDMYKTGYLTNYGRNKRTKGLQRGRTTRSKANRSAKGADPSSDPSKSPRAHSDHDQSGSVNAVPAGTPPKGSTSSTTNSASSTDVAKSAKLDPAEQAGLSGRKAYIRALDQHGLAPERIHVVRPSDKGSSMVDISNYGLGHKRLMALACSLSARAFEGFKCSGNRLDEVTAATLISSLSRDCQTIDLHHNQIAMGGCQALVHSVLLPPQNELLVLSVASNSLGDDCVSELAVGLKGNKTLRRLNLAKNNISQRGAQAIVDSLKSSVSLWELDFSWNAVGRAIFDLFDRLRTIQHLNLSHNGLGAVLRHKEKFGPTFAEEVAPILARNLSLLHLDLSGNHFPVSVLKVLAAALAQNHTILGLHMDGESHGFVDSYGFIKVRKPRVPQFRAAAASSSVLPLAGLPDSVRESFGLRSTGTSSLRMGRPAPPLSLASGHVEDQLDEWVRQPYTLSRAAPREMCWICGGWSEIDIALRVAKDDLTLPPPDPQESRLSLKRQTSRGTKKSRDELDAAALADAIDTGTGAIPPISDLEERASAQGLHIHLSCDNFRPCLLQKVTKNQKAKIIKFMTHRCVPAGSLYFFFSVPKKNNRPPSEDQQLPCTVFVSRQFRTHEFNRHLFSFAKLTEIDSALHKSSLRIKLPDVLNVVHVETRQSPLMCRFAPPRYRRTDANAPTATFRGGEGTKWRPAISIFATRAQDSDAKDFYVSDKFLQRSMRSDVLYSKCERLVEADFGDSQKAGVATIQESMMDVLAQYSREFNRLFQLTMAHFVEINDDPFSMKKNGFTNFIKKCGFTTPSHMRVLSTLDGIAYSVPASPIDSARLDLIFVQINVEDEAEEDDEMAAFMNDENPDNAVNRFELVESILRIATCRFSCIGAWEDHPDLVPLKALKFENDDRGAQEKSKHFASSHDAEHPTTKSISLALAIELTLLEVCACVRGRGGIAHYVFQRDTFH